MNDGPKKILIIKPSALGDVVTALPAVRCLGRTWPDAKISWFIRPEYSALVAENKYVDDIIVFDRKKLGKWWYQPAAFAELWRLVRKLRKEKFDIVFDFQGRFRTAIFAWLSGSKKRIGIKGTQEFTRSFYTDGVDAKSDAIHLIDHYIEMVCFAGAKKCDVDFELTPSADAAKSMRQKLGEKKVNAEKYMVFVLSSAIESKCWPVENFAALADKLWKKYQMSIITTGVLAERAVSEKLQALTDSNVVGFAGDTTIAELMAMLADARMVVSGDTGPGHIASALGVPLVMMFGQTNPRRVGPYNRLGCFVAIGADNRSDAIESGNEAHDVKNITVEDVFEKICLQLDVSNS